MFKETDAMKNYDTIIFDLDGTLLNTLDDLADSVNFALCMHGFPERTIFEIRSFVGNGIARLIELSIPRGMENPKYNECLKDFKLHYSNNMNNKTAPYEGIMELLKRLSHDNYKTAIVSNKFDGAVKKLNKIYFEEYIDVAIGESENISRKPAPDTVFKAIEELGSNRASAIYVGDSEVDVKTAKNAGIPCIGAAWGFRGRDVLESKGADYVIDRPEEILDIISR